MTLAIEQRILCPILVGREPERAALAERIAQLDKHVGGVVLISGEAGIGKTRLVAEVRARASAAGARVFQGNCFEPDRALPYAPVLDLLRRTVAACSPEEVEAKVGPAASEVVKLLPELAVILPGAIPSARLEPEQEKRRLFEVLAAMLLRCADDGPALIVVEDLHWCDDIGLEFLLHLARRIATRPLLLLMTYRSDEQHAGLTHLLASMDRERLATEVTLKPLDADGVAAMLQAIFALTRPARMDFLTRLYGQTEGNPFFVEETLKALVVAGDIFYRDGAWDRKAMDELNIPRSVHDAVRRRTRELSPAAREALAVAAVAGQRFDFALVREVTGHEEGPLLDAFKELIAAQLIVELTADQLAFRHALTRQAVYADLLARERKALHRALAETIERVYRAERDARLAELAYHYYEAEVWDRALESAREVGQRSLALSAPHAALEQFTRALEASRRLTVQPAPALHRGRGHAYETLGDFERARADYEAALAGARRAGDREEEWRALVAVGLLWAGRDYTRTGAYYRLAFELARVMDDRLMLARSLNRLGNWYLNAGQALEALALHREALTIVEALGAERGIAETLDLLGMACWLSGDPLEGAAHYERAVALWRAVGDRQMLSSSLTALVGCGVSYSSESMFPALHAPGQTDSLAEEARLAASETGWRAGESFALWQYGSNLGARGDYSEALELARRGMAIADEIEHRQWMSGSRWVLGALLTDLLCYEPAREHLQRALALAQEMGSRLWIACNAGFLAVACVALGDLDGADAALATVPLVDETEHIAGERCYWRGRAELALARGEPTFALRVMDHVVASTPHAERGIPRVALIRGNALAALGRLVEAEHELRGAAATAREQGWRELTWRSALSLGNLLRKLRRMEEAEAAFAEARGIVARIAATLPEGEPRTTFEREAAKPLPAEAPPSRRAEAERYSGLTAREREVARLVARGKSNRNIAGDLVLSERTVESHVTNILLKLGFTSRAQIAVWATQMGLTRD